MKAEKLTKINLFVNILPLVLLLLLYIIGYFSSFVLYVYSEFLLLILLPLFITFSIICLVICISNYARLKAYIINSVILVLQIITFIVDILN